MIQAQNKKGEAAQEVQLQGDATGFARKQNSMKKTRFLL